jgi:hypothetical protein
MFKRYLIASLAGILIGMFAMLSAGLADWNDWWQKLKLPGIASWYALQTCRTYLAPEFVSLNNQAVLLRACQIFVQHGVTYMSIPALLLFGLVKLTHIGRNNRLGRSLCYTAWALICMNMCAGVLGLIFGIDTETNLERSFTLCIAAANSVLIASCMVSIPFVIVAALFQFAFEFGPTKQLATLPIPRVAVTILSTFFILYATLCFLVIGLLLLLFQH